MIAIRLTTVFAIPCYTFIDHHDCYNALGLSDHPVDVQMDCLKIPRYVCGSNHWLQNNVMQLIKPFPCNKTAMHIVYIFVFLKETQEEQINNW